MSSTNEELEKWVEMYTQLTEEARVIIYANASVLLASEEMRKQEQVV